MFEPQIFAMVVSSKMGQRLHIGVHFSLEDAYAVARTEMEALGQHKPGDAVDIQLWNMVPAHDVLNKMIDTGKIHVQSVVFNPIEPPMAALPVPEPNIDDYIMGMRDSKNGLMKKLIAEGNIEKVAEVKGLLGANSSRYVIKAIEKNNVKTEPMEGSSKL